MRDIPFHRLVTIPRSFEPSLSPDGRTLAYVSDPTGYPEAFIHRGREREPRRLTEYRERVGRIRWTPDGRLLVLDTDLGGDERWALRSVRPDGGGHRALSHDPAVMHLLGEVSPDGSLLTCATNARDPAIFDLSVVHVETGETRTVLAEDASDLPGGFSPDGRWIVASRFFGSFRQDLLLVPTSGGPPTGITPEGVAVRHIFPRFEPGGESLLLLTDRGRDRLGLARLALETHEVAWIHAPDDRDVELLELSRDGRTALVSENDGGWSRLAAIDVASGRVRPMDHPKGVVTAVTVSADGTRGAFAFECATSPSEIHLADLTTGTTERATDAPRDDVPEEHLVRPEEVRFASFDGTEIPGWLYVPTGYSGPRPAVVKVHGGPEAQARPVYDPVVQYLVSRGFAVYEPNVRGSLGYGRAFAALDDGRLRFDAVKDLAHAAGFLRNSGRVDGERLSLLGGSYGGFMVLAGLAFFPDLWKAGVDICGIANFRTFLENTGPYRRAWREAEYGDPVADREFLDGISPVLHADRIRAPLLVIQGGNDPRVPASEAEQIVAAVESRSGIAEYLLFDDEGHGIVKRKNRIRAYEAVVRFLLEHGT